MLVGMAWEHFCTTVTAGALVFRGLGCEITGAGTFESLLHRHIRNDKTPENVKVFRGFVFSGGQKSPFGNIHGNTGCWSGRLH